MAFGCFRLDVPDVATDQCPAVEDVGVTSSPLSIHGFTAPGRPECIACDEIHPLWPSHSFYPPFADLRLDHHAAGLVMRALAAAGDGSPECNTALLYAPVEAYRQGLVNLRTSERQRHRSTKERQKGRASALTHELTFYTFNVITFLWSLGTAKHTDGDVAATLLEKVIFPANDLIKDVPEDLVLMAGAVFHAALNSRYRDTEGLFRNLFRESMNLEVLAEQRRPSDVFAGMHGMLMTAASYSIYAGATLTRTAT